MKITNTTLIVELTVEESSVTINRKRTIVTRDGEPAETPTSEPSGTVGETTIKRINDGEYRGKHERSTS
jgi:hypothetical protein